jgi:hypothetical protein
MIKDAGENRIQNQLRSDSIANSMPINAGDSKFFGKRDSQSHGKNTIAPRLILKVRQLVRKKKLNSEDYENSRKSSDDISVKQNLVGAEKVERPDKKIRFVFESQSHLPFQVRV